MSGPPPPRPGCNAPDRSGANLPLAAAMLMPKLARAGIGAAGAAGLASPRLGDCKAERIVQRALRARAMGQASPAGSPRRLVCCFGQVAVLTGFLGYKRLDWWVPAVIAGAVAAGQFFYFQTLLGGQGARLELLFSLILNLTMYYATFSIGRAIGQRRARRRKREPRRGGP